MGLEVSIGGNRLGSGGGMTTELHNYQRSTHNLSELWQTSMAPGVLYPFLSKVALNGDTFDIDLNAVCRTIPTKGPLFSSFKMQLDVFQIPMRLYNGILHNNPINIGMKMNQVYMPKILMTTKAEYRKPTQQISKSSLAYFLGISGLGLPSNPENTTVERRFNAIPFLGYADVYKCYYANKQEEYAYQIVGQNDPEANIREVGREVNGSYERIAEYSDATTSVNVSGGIYADKLEEILIHTDEEKEHWQLAKYEVRVSVATGHGEDREITWFDYELKTTVEHGNKIFFVYKPKYEGEVRGTAMIHIKSLARPFGIQLEKFALQNIDQMREEILQNVGIGNEFTISSGGYAPYEAWCDNYNDLTLKNRMPLNGLLIKTYQSDIFNNWVRTDWIDGDNGIGALTAIDVSSGNFTMDALNLMQKLYNMLNRVAVSGGTYEDWQEAVYTTETIRKAETPIYCGGLSKEVVFEEVVSTAEATDADGETSALGTLGGRGTLSDKHKGGKLIVKVNEPSYIMGIISLTPRISYSQGNSWDMTELNTFDDLHKPALDGIGFEDLIGERMAWFDTTISDSGQLNRNSYGKLPAWINYMTSFDKVGGDFAEEDGKAFMVLNRNYEYDEENGGIKDATTYIDPSKYNYAFAYSDLEAQNFWVSVKSNIEARRIMSAKIIPNL